MSIRFTHKRLHVGYRAKDWSDVWTAPQRDENNPQKLNVNEEGEADILLYRFTLGEAGYREPMEGEVKWHPLFDLKNCESSYKGEQKRMQKQFLTDAYKYLAEKDPEKIRTMEEELDQPGFSRWQRWFEEAKRFKRSQIRQRGNRRKKRIQQAADAGASEFEIQKQVNSDSSDSAYETDDGERSRMSRSTSHMPPPPRPSPKRRNTNMRQDRLRNGAKKQKSSDLSDGIKQNDTFSPHLMSGGLGNRTPSVKSNNNRSSSGSLSTRGDRIDDEEDGSVSDEVMDTQNPNTQSPPLFFGDGQTWDFNQITPALTSEQIEQPVFGGRPRRSSINNIGPQNSVPETQNQRNQDENGPEVTVEEHVDPEDRGRRHIREQSVLGLNDEDALKAAIRASQEPHSREEDERVVDSIEEGADDS